MNLLTKTLFTAIVVIGYLPKSSAQSYTYQAEGFEDTVWSTAVNNPSNVAASTGTWSSYKGNGMSNVTAANSGNYCFLIAKKDGLVTPLLENGAQTLTYYAKKTSSRTLYVESSIDKTTWTAVDTYTATDKWVKRSVSIANKDIKYIRFRTNSNGGLYLDDIKITAFGEMSEIEDSPLAYFTQKFEDTTQFPTESPTTPMTIDIPGQGSWIYLKSYKDANDSYILDGSAYCLRMLKNGSYVEMPILTHGVTNISFDEGRKGRDMSVYSSKDNGSSWNLVETIETSTNGHNTVEINDSTVNRLKLSNESGSDMDVDNISITVFPYGTKPQISTGEAYEISKNSATVGSELINEGDMPVVEEGICWAVDSVPQIAHNKILYTGNEAKFSVSLTGLPSGSEVKYRAFASSYAGTAYGEIKVFTTNKATVPILTTLTATKVTGESAVSGGNITDLGGTETSQKGVCWNTSGNPTIDDNKVAAKTDSAYFNVTMMKLEQNTTYYYRAFAVNSAGTGYGETKILATGFVSKPSVSTVSASSIHSYKALLVGRLTDGGNGYTEKGFCWNTSGTPTVNDNKVICDSDNVDFSSWITNLHGNTTYYARAYATNGAGTTYGDAINFTTTSSNTYFISPTGDDINGNGSQTAPFYSLQKAVDLATPGDSIIMAGGIYKYPTRINISRCGEPDGGTIAVVAPKGERAVLDFSSMALGDNNQGIRLSGSYWYFYGLDIKGAGDNGMLIERNKPVGGTYVDVMNRTEAHDNTIEFCSFVGNQDTGLQLKNMAANNRIINCDAYYNCDPDMGDADGFAPKLTVGSGNYFYGCRSWNNSDDGWDGLLTATENGFPDDMTTEMENCWAFNNGFLKDGSEGKGNGNGFKLGGGTYQRHNMILKRCLAFNNLMKSFDQNHNVGNMTLINCTGYSSKYNNKNHYTYKIDGTILAAGKKLTLTNCVAVWDGLIESKSAYGACDLVGGNVTTCDFQTSPSDYVTIDTTGTTAKRNSDGSLPDIKFMQIAPGNTKLIDKGTFVDGITFNGAAPDLGCFETDVITTIKTIAVNPDTSSPLSVSTDYGNGNFTLFINIASDKDVNSVIIYNTGGNELYAKTFVGNRLNVCFNKKAANNVYIIKVLDRSINKSYTQKIYIQQ